MQIEEEIPDYEAEREVFGVDHAEIGAVLAETWKFDNEIINSIQYHHSLLKSRADLVTAVVSISNLFAKKAGLCLAWDEKSFDIKSFSGWEMLAEQSRMNIDVDHTILQLTAKNNSVKESVRELLAPV